MSLISRLVLSGESAARTHRTIRNSSRPTAIQALLRTASGFPSARLRFAALAGSLLLVPAVRAQSDTAAAFSLPDAPGAISAGPLESVEVSSASPSEDFPEQQSTPDQTSAPPQAPAPATTTPAGEQTPQTGSTVSPELKGQTELGNEQLKKQEQQRVFGVIPAFNSVYQGTVPPLTPGQKMKLMWKSTTDVYVFGFAAITAGIGQAQDSHEDYGQGVEGYAKRFGANYADTADGNFWGNAVLPIVMHEDPRYFRLGHGTFIHRLLYSMSTTVWCKRDNGTEGPNYANVLGNLISGGISNLYYPPEDRGAEQTFQNAATVTAEGMIGAAMIEFWPDILHHHQAKMQEKRAAAAAAARNAQAADPPGPPQ